MPRLYVSILALQVNESLNMLEPDVVIAACREASLKMRRAMGQTGFATMLLNGGYEKTFRDNLAAQFARAGMLAYTERGVYSVGPRRKQVDLIVDCGQCLTCIELKHSFLGQRFLKDGVIAVTAKGPFALDLADIVSLAGLDCPAFSTETRLSPGGFLVSLVTSVALDGENMLLKNSRWKSGRTAEEADALLDAVVTAYTDGFKDGLKDGFLECSHVELHHLKTRIGSDNRVTTLKLHLLLVRV